MAETILTDKKYRVHQGKAEMEDILLKMNPLINKYARKLYFLNKDDAKQELALTLVEAFCNISNKENEAVCVAYIHKSIINKYYYLNKKYKKEKIYIDNSENKIEDFPFRDNYNRVEIYILLNDISNKFNNKQKQIIRYFINELSDAEISVKVGVSRQYINRFRKQIRKEIMLQ